MRAWEEAKIMGKRAFYERATDTIRACPENYLLAFRNNQKWIGKGDAATSRYWPQIQAQLDTWQGGSTADALAQAIAEICPKTEGYEAWQKGES